MSAVAMITLLATCQTSTAYFWTQNPAAWDHDDTPPSGSSDGSLSAIGDNNQGYQVSLVCMLNGFSDPDAPTIIEKTQQEQGLSCVWVTSYYLYVERENEKETTKCEVKLQLYIKDDGQGQWNLADTDTAAIIINFYEGGSKTESGHLYVWCDCEYDEPDQFKLVATAKCQRFVGGWQDIIPPVTDTAYYEIDEV